MVNLWLFGLFNMYGFRLVVSFWNVFGLLNVMWLFLVSLSSVLFCMNDRRGVIYLDNRFVMNLNVVFGGLFMGNVYGRFVVFCFWFSVMSLDDLFCFLDVVLLFVMDFNIVLLSGLLVVGLGNMNWFYVVNLSMVSSLFMFYFINNVDISIYDILQHWHLNFVLFFL